VTTWACVDPGLKRCGVAVFARPGGLVWAGLVHGAAGDDPVIEMADAVVNTLTQTPSEAFIETPQQYPNSPVPRESLEKLSLVAGAISQALPRSVKVHRFYPRAWKGQVPKAVMVRRIKAHLSGTERLIVDALDLPASSVHNVWDAVGIGLWATGRIGKR